MGKISEGLEKANYENSDMNLLEPDAEFDLSAVPSSADHTEQNIRIQDNAVRSGSVSTGAWDARLFKAVNEDMPIAELFKNLRSKILHPPGDRPRPQTILVASAIPGEGKSFVTANLGTSLAQGVDQFCLMVDCDLRRPSLSKLFGVKARKGLVDYLRDGRELGDLLQRTSLDKLTILPAGVTPQNPAELLGSARMHSLLAELADRYSDRIILFDSSPMQAASETMVLANQMDGVIVVVREGKSRRGQVRKLVDSIEQERLLGVVFNGYTTNIIERSLMEGYGYSSYQGYY